VVKRSLGKRIVALRRARKLSQEGLAERSGYSVEFISLVERGVNAPSVAGLEKIANALHVEIKHLFDFRKAAK
jgi:transcriptional regulator with XRE-family HTH domain